MHQYPCWISPRRRPTTYSSCSVSHAPHTCDSCIPLRQSVWSGNAGFPARLGFGPTVHEILSRLFAEKNAGDARFRWCNVDDGTHQTRVHRHDGEQWKKATTCINVRSATEMSWRCKKACTIASQLPTFESVIRSEESNVHVIGLLPVADITSIDYCSLFKIRSNSN